uniref:Uncharacterized protein n=1 Tax=Timema bartmani TaxID=61472 RepID=A0A7R9HVR2_9NEOP|nr:unnamed protein product [Timema bartmani]
MRGKLATLQDKRKDALMKRLGPNAHPFTMEMTPLAPPSVQLVPAKEYSGAPIGTSYDVRAYIASDEPKSGVGQREQWQTSWEDNGSSGRHLGRVRRQSMNTLRSVPGANLFSRIAQLRKQKSLLNEMQKYHKESRSGGERGLISVSSGQHPVLFPPPRPVLISPRVLAEGGPGALYVCVWWGGGGKDATTREKEREDDELTLMWASLSCNLLSIDLMVPRYPPAPLEGRQLSAWRNSSNKERSESSMKIYELTRV